MKDKPMKVVVTRAELRKPRTREQEAQVKSLAAMPEAAIDLSEMPQVTDEAWKDARRFSEMFKPRKRLVSMRLDADVLEWLRNSGPGYQSRVNEVLREHMRSALGRPR